MITDKLKQNDAKSEFLIIGPRQQLSNPSTYGLQSNSELLLAPASTKTKKTLGDRASKLKTFLFRAAYPMKSL